MRQKQINSIFNLWKDGASLPYAVEGLIQMSASPRDAAEAICYFLSLIDIYKQDTALSKETALYATKSAKAE